MTPYQQELLEEIALSLRQVVHLLEEQSRRRVSPQTALRSSEVFLSTDQLIRLLLASDRSGAVSAAYLRDSYVVPANTLVRIVQTVPSGFVARFFGLQTISLDRYIEGESIPLTAVVDHKWTVADSLPLTGPVTIDSGLFPWSLINVVYTVQNNSTHDVTVSYDAALALISKPVFEEVVSPLFVQQVDRLREMII